MCNICEMNAKEQRVAETPPVENPPLQPKFPRAIVDEVRFSDVLLFHAVSTNNVPLLEAAIQFGGNPNFDVEELTEGALMEYRNIRRELLKLEASGDLDLLLLKK